MFTGQMIFKQPSTPSAKMKDAIVICGGAAEPYLEAIPLLLRQKDAYFIGADRGALQLIRAGYSLTLAIGDFDSVTPEEKEYIKKNSQSMHSYPSEKDETDMELALIEASKYPSLPIYILGGLGSGHLGRLDHLLANLFVVLKEPFTSLAERIHWLERHTYARYYHAGKHTIEDVNQCDYVSFISLSPIKKLSIQGAKYDLKPTDLKAPHAYISNEFIAEQPIHLSFTSGVMLALHLKEGK